MIMFRIVLRIEIPLSRVMIFGSPYCGIAGADIVGICRIQMLAHTEIPRSRLIQKVSNLQASHKPMQCAAIQ